MPPHFHCGRVNNSAHPYFGLEQCRLLICGYFLTTRLQSVVYIELLRRVIKKFSAWPSSVQNKIKTVFASYSSKAQNTTHTMWLLGYKYFVQFSIWTKSLSDGVETANTRTAHKFLKNFSNDTDMIQQKFISTRYSGWNVDPPLWFWVRTTKHAIERMNPSKLSFHYTA